MMKRITILLLSALLTLPAFAQIPLALSTASQAVKLGPFVDSTDGNTEKTALTINNTDIKCSKNGGTLASKNSGGGTHDANGWYTVTFDATDTNTAGRLTCYVHVAGALPVFREFTVGPVGVNATQVGGTAQTGRDLGASVLLSSGTGTGQLDFTSGVVKANPVQWNGTTVATPDTAGYPKVTIKDGTGTGEIDTNAGAVVSVTTAATATNLTNAPTNGDFTSTMKTSIGTAVAASAVASIAAGGITEASFATTAGSFKPLGIIDQGTAQAYTAGTPSLTLRSAAAFGDNTLAGVTAVICGSTQGYCQSMAIASNVGSTDVATLTAALPVAASGTVTYYLFGTAPGAAGTLDATAVENAVWNGARASHTTAGSFGAYVLADTTKFGGTTVTGRDLGTSVLLSSGTGTGQLSLSSGTVTVGTNNDKTGYTASTVSDKTGYTLSSAGINAFADTATSGHTGAGTWGGAWNAAGANGDPWSTALPGAYSAGSAGYILGTNLNGTITSRQATVTFPTNFSSMAISGGGAVTAGTVSDKTGYSLSQSFPANFASLAITGGGAVTAGTVSDKTGYSLSVAPLTQAQVQAALGTVTGTCSSGSTTTCLDAALTEGSSTQLVDQVFCTDPATPAERWCSLISGFNTGTHTITTTKTRSASMSGKAYAIYPSTVN